MSDMIANAMDPEYMPRDLPRASTLPENQHNIQILRRADPEMRKRVFSVRLEPDVRKLYPLNYQRILGVLVGWEVEDLFDMLADGWLMKSKVEEVAVDLGVAGERDTLDYLGDVLNNMRLEQSGTLDLPPPPAAAAAASPAQQQDYQFQRGARQVSSRLSTSAAEFIPQSFMQQQRAMQATLPPDNNDLQVGDASSSAGSLMHQGGDPSLTGVKSTHYDQMLPPMDQPPSPQPSSGVATAVNAVNGVNDGGGDTRGDERALPTWNADLEDHLREILGRERHVMMDMDDVRLLKERVKRQLDIVPGMTDSADNPGQLVQVLVKMNDVLDRQAKHLAERRNLLQLQQADHDKLCDLAHEHRDVLGKLDKLALSSGPLLTDGQQQQQQLLPGHQRQQQALTIAPQQDDLPQHPKQQQQQQDSSSRTPKQKQQQRRQQQRQQQRQQKRQQQDGTLEAQQAEQRRPQTRSQTVQPSSSLTVSLSTRDHRDRSIPPGYYAQYHNAAAAAAAALAPRHAAPQAMTMPGMPGMHTMPGMHALPHWNVSATAAASGAYSPLTQRQTYPYLAAGNHGCLTILLDRTILLAYQCAEAAKAYQQAAAAYQHVVAAAAAGQALPSYAPSPYPLPGLPSQVRMLPPPPGAQHPATATPALDSYIREI
ncbi:uncharacterized protein LOC135829035 isoform X2 [Sycon ciliatum]|uniref:uncharacterized protein LOC135829035 isoform X2 n=1 Tax=Sycon ciliatum TaxID=27933 RepID=UPI0031F64E20